MDGGWSRVSGEPSARSLSGGERAVDALERSVTAEHGKRLEDARRDGRSRQRDADWLEDVLGLHAARLDHGAKRRLDALGGERLYLGHGSAGRGQARRA